MTPIRGRRPHGIANLLEILGLDLVDREKSSPEAVFTRHHLSFVELVAGRRHDARHLQQLVKMALVVPTIEVPNTLRGSRIAEDQKEPSLGLLSRVLFRHQPSSCAARRSLRPVEDWRRVSRNARISCLTCGQAVLRRPRDA